MRRGFDASRGDELGRLENVEGRKVAIFRFAFVDVGQGGVGGAEVDADFHVSSSLREGEGRCYAAQRGRWHTKKWKAHVSSQ